MKGKCELCCSESKYRCPKCAILYCSLSCYKVHKGDDSPLPCNQSAVKKISNSTNDQHRNTKLEDDIKKEEYMVDVADIKEEDRVPIFKLESLSDNPVLKDMLKNQDLRQILKNVDTNDSSNNAILEVAMKEPIFVEFVDECLRSIEDEKLLIKS